MAAAVATTAGSSQIAWLTKDLEARTSFQTRKSVLTECKRAFIETTESAGYPSEREGQDVVTTVQRGSGRQAASILTSSLVSIGRERSLLQQSGGTHVRSESDRDNFVAFVVGIRALYVDYISFRPFIRKRYIFLYTLSPRPLAAHLHTKDMYYSATASPYDS